MTNSPANLAGDYHANKSFTIIGTLSDKFTSVEFSATVATESVVMSYDKDGRVGIGKVVEQGKAGSLDIAGDIYAGGKQIQQHQLTSNNGTSRNISVDPDTIVENGFYYLLNCPNRPFDTNGYLIVERYDSENEYEYNKYIVQTFKNVYNGNQYIRVKNYGVWGPWVEQVRADHPNLINTGWISTGAPGVDYKRQGDVVALRMRITTTDNQTYSLGRIPAELIPIPNGGTMMRVTAWTAEQSIGRNLQINVDGTMALLQTNRGDTFNTQVTWII